MITRRKAIGSLLAAGATAVAGSSQGMSSVGFSYIPQNSKNDDMVIEWNAHIFSPDTKKYPFHPKATYQPDVSVQPADPLAEYLKRLDEEDIDRAVIVHPEPYGDDHSLILACLQREPERLRGHQPFLSERPGSTQKTGSPCKTGTPHCSNPLSCPPGQRKLSGYLCRPRRPGTVETGR